jgi:hypothetical protein
MTEPNDYTVLPVGTKTAKGEVVVCPYCKKNGLLVIVNGKEYYNHRLGVYFTDVSLKETKVIDESCPQTHVQRAEHESDQPK